MNSILQVEALTSTSKVQSIMHALQKIHFVVGKYAFLLQDPVKAVAIDRAIGRLVVYKDATFVLIFIELFEMLREQENVYACTHAYHKTSLVAV